MLEEFFKSSLFKRAFENVEVVVTSQWESAAHTKHCSSLSRKGGVVKTISRNRASRVRWGWCCSDAHLDEDLDLLGADTAVGISAVLEVHTMLKRSEIPGPGMLAKLQRISQYPEAYPPILVAAAAELEEAASKQLQAWIDSPEADGFLDLLAVLYKEETNTFDLNTADDISNLPTSVEEFISMRTSKGMMNGNYADRLRRRDSMRETGFLLVKAPSPVTHRVAGLICEKYKVADGVFKLPRHLRALTKSRGYKARDERIAVLLKSDTAQIVETASVLLKDGYESVAAALRAARQLEKN